MCLYPRLIQNPKYKRNNKNGGNVPPIPDKRVQYVPIACKNCIECRKKKAREWQVRLMEDIKQYKNGKFVTLTFSDQQITKLIHEINGRGKLKGYALDNAIATIATRRFLERWRQDYKTSLRHWLITELGHNGTENIHLHGIIWTDHNLNLIEKYWKYGFVWKGKMINGKLQNYVNEQTVNYITKYVTKIDETHTKYQAKILTSAGIGRNYTTGHNAKSNRYKGEETIETYRTRTGHKIAMPIYWRNKIYTDQEREQLWINKLNKEERWVCGEKIDVSKGYEEYEKLVQWHRHRSYKLGYSNQYKTGEREVYENKRRAIMQETRLKKGTDKINKDHKRHQAN